MHPTPLLSNIHLKSHMIYVYVQYALSCYSSLQATSICIVSRHVCLKHWSCDIFKTGNWLHSGIQQHVSDHSKSLLQIVVVEEAAEILEAHALAGLPPSVEQFLQIGEKAVALCRPCTILYLNRAVSLQS
jgi:hypothetical protein